jgi:hypothetical protein
MTDIKKRNSKNGIAKMNDEDKVKRLANYNDLIHRKIQLWTNNEENEYALRLLLDGDPESEIRKNREGDRFLASTNPIEQYTHPVAETDKLDLLRNGWDYTLKNLVRNYKKERIESLGSSQSMLHEENSKMSLSYISNVGESDNDYPIKFISQHKCAYCLAEFKNEKEREKHELNWHI